MPSSADQSPFNASARDAGTTLGPNSGVSSDQATSAGTVGSNSASGHGQHPKDREDSNATLPGSKVGVQNEDLDGEQMRAPGEGEVMKAQLDKKDAGWGEQDSLTSDLDGKKKEQAAARDEQKEKRAAGQDVDGGAGNRLENEGLSSV